MAGYDNIKDQNTKRTPEERRELAAKAGKASGKARRQKADFRRDINLLLMTMMPDNDITARLKEMGIDPTIGMGMHMKMALEVLNNGSVSAYRALAEYSGQYNQMESEDSEDNIQSFLRAMNPTPEELESLFVGDEEVGNIAKETETTCEI